MLCAIWYHLRNLKNVSEKQPWRSVTFSKVVGFTKSNTPWVFFTFFKLYEWYQIVQYITYG